jgi:hypothetical protein
MRNSFLKHILSISLCFASSVVSAHDHNKQQSRTLEFTLPAVSIDKKSLDHNASLNIIKKEQVNKEQLDEQKINIVKRTIPLMTPELKAMEERVNKLLKQNIDIKTVQNFQSQSSLLMEYVERQFYLHEDEQRHIQLILLTALLIGPDSTSKLLHWGGLFRQYPHRLRAVIHALSNWPSTKETEAFVHSVLQAEVQSPIVVRAALLYQANNKNQSANLYIGQYSIPRKGANYRYLSLYLAAVLGEKSYTRFILEAFDKKPPAYQQYYLLLALSKALDKKDFNQIAQSQWINKNIRSSVLRQASFDSSAQQPTSELDIMLNSAYAEEQQVAIDYLIQHKNYQKLAELIKNKGILGVKIYHQAVFAGLPAEELGVLLKPQSKPLLQQIAEEVNNNWKVFLPLILLLAGMLVLAKFYLKRLRKNNISI